MSTRWLPGFSQSTSTKPGAIQGKKNSPSVFKTAGYIYDNDQADAMVNYVNFNIRAQNFIRLRMGKKDGFFCISPEHVS